MSDQFGFDYGYNSAPIGGVNVTPSKRHEAKQRYEGVNFTRFSSTTVYVDNTVSRPVLAGNHWRQYLLIQNVSSGDIWVNFGAEANSNQGIKISAGGFYELDTRPPFNQINVFGTSATQQPVIIIEGILDLPNR